jgi:FecR protein
VQIHRAHVAEIGWPIMQLVLIVALLVSLGGAAMAQDQADPPGRVARLNYIEGSVSFQPAGTNDWLDANPNRPLTTGDNLWADDQSRGELHIGATTLHISSQTGISFLNLNDQATQIQLAQGVISVHVRELYPDEAFEIDTPNLAFSVLRPGDYRISVDPNGNSTVVDVRGGSGEVTGGGQAFNLNPGEEYAFSGTDQLSYDAEDLPGPDDFDTWCLQRDQREDRSASARYVSRDVTGYEDLDNYGSWSQDPQYGAVWIPSSVPDGWAPYHYGHWAYISPWGWTWVEDEPWGFAPFHYGRWAVVGGGWAWVPGPVAVVVVGRPAPRPVYAPALVGFVGGGGFGVALAIGGGAGVAWFPLGPRDVWVPAYRCSPRYVQQVNITNTRVVNVTQVTNVYNNVYINHTVVNNYTYQTNVRAVTAVDRETFVSGRPVAQARVQITQEQIQHPQVTDRTAFQPTHASVVGFNKAARNAPPAALANRPIVTKMAPAPQVRPIGHTQTLAVSHDYKPAVAAGAAPRAQTIQPHESNRGPAGAGANPNQPRNNNPRPGFQSFSNNPNATPNNRATQTAPPNEQPRNVQPETARPENARPENARPENAQPNNPRPAFQPPPPRNNGNVNGSSNVQPRNEQPRNEQPNPENARPENGQPSNPRPAFQPPPRAQAPEENSRPAAQPPAHNNPPDRATQQNQQHEEQKTNKQPPKKKPEDKDKNQ